MIRRGKILYTVRGRYAVATDRLFEPEMHLLLSSSRNIELDDGWIWVHAAGAAITCSYSL